MDDVVDTLSRSLSDMGVSSVREPRIAIALASDLHRLQATWNMVHGFRIFGKRANRSSSGSLGSCLPEAVSGAKHVNDEHVIGR